MCPEETEEEEEEEDKKDGLVFKKEEIKKICVPIIDWFWSAVWVKYAFWW